MEKLEDMLKESNPEKIKYYMDYYEMLMIMLEKRNLENDLEMDYKLIKDRYNELTHK